MVRLKEGLFGLRMVEAYKGFRGIRRGAQAPYGASNAGDTSVADQDEGPDAVFWR